MGNKVKQIKKSEVVNELFDEAQEEINEKVKQDTKKKIKDLLTQRTSAERVLKNIDRQIEDLKLQIVHELS